MLRTILIVHSVPLVAWTATYYMQQRSKKGGFSVGTYPANDPCEDKLLTQFRKDWKFGVVLDGHGGHQVADFAAKKLSKFVDSHFMELEDDITATSTIVHSFDEIESELKQTILSIDLDGKNVSRIGSALVVAAQKDDKLVVANCGDCRAVMGSERQVDGLNNFLATCLTEEHNIRCPKEKEKLLQLHPDEADLIVTMGDNEDAVQYVKGKIQLTRSIGDFEMKYPEFGLEQLREGQRKGVSYMTHTPDVVYRKLDTSDKFVILASDGLWDHLSPQEAVEIVGNCIVGDVMSRAATYLVERAVAKAAQKAHVRPNEIKSIAKGPDRRRIHDDTTAVIIYF